MILDLNDNYTSQYKHLSLFWTDILHLMSGKPHALASVGPMRAFMTNSKKISTEMIEINEILVEFNKYLAEYYNQLINTWNTAQKKVNLTSLKIPNDAEQADAIKRTWIGIFDNDFTELFDSAKFGENYGMLVSKELELTNHWNAIVNTILRSANIPSKDEIDEIYKEVHALKKRVNRLEMELEKAGVRKKNV